MHYFSGKGCSESLESMHYCIGILILAGLLVCLELQTELMVKLTVILCAGGYAGLIPGFFGGIFYLYRMDLRKPSAGPAADLAAEAEKASADPASLIYFHNN